MTNTKSTKRALLASVMALLLCFAMLLGTTFAWFTDTVSNGVNKIVSGNLDVELYHMNFAEAVEASNWSLGFGIPKDATGEKIEANTKLFLNENGDEMLWEPGATCVESFRIKNEGSLALKYQFKLEVENATATPEGKTLADIINISSDEINYNDAGTPMGTTKLTDRPLGDGYVFEGTLEAGEQYDFWIGLQWVSSDVDNEYNVKGGLKLDLGVTLLATQYTSEFDNFYDGDQYDQGAEYPVIVTVDTWDGTVDTSWYEEGVDTFALSTAEQFAGFAMLVGQGKLSDETILLKNDIDLAIDDTADTRSNSQYIGDSFAPIGSTGTFDDRGRLVCETFEGIFDGEGHTISNIYQSGWDFGYEWGQYGSIGLFSSLNNATVKNVVIDGFEAQVEGGDISFIAGSATGTCVFENITIKNSKIGTYNNGIGGIIGWSGAGEYTFKNITIAEDVVVGGLWGSFDSSVGGIVGQAEPGATYNFENVDVACRLDVYNDCTASYDYYNYRMCGMLIGRLEETTTIDGYNYPDTSKYNITCTDVTVTYGEWANYHYCRAEGARGKRVEAGYSYDGVAADYDHSACTVHCKELIAFDQIFGGDQYAVKGLPAYDGVTVIYNNK